MKLSRHEQPVAENLFLLSVSLEYECDMKSEKWGGYFINKIHPKIDFSWKIEYASVFIISWLWKIETVKNEIFYSIFLKEKWKIFIRFSTAWDFSMSFGSIFTFSRIFRAFSVVSLGKHLCGMKISRWKTFVWIQKLLYDFFSKGFIILDYTNILMSGCYSTTKGRKSWGRIFKRSNSKGRIIWWA